MGKHRQGTGPRPVQAPAETEPLAASPEAAAGPWFSPQEQQLAQHAGMIAATAPFPAAPSEPPAPRPLPQHRRPRQPRPGPAAVPPRSGPVVIPFGPVRVPEEFAADARATDEGGLPVFSALVAERGWAGLHVPGIPPLAGLPLVAEGDWVGAVVALRKACSAALEENAARFALTGDRVRRELDATGAWVRGIGPSFTMHQAAGGNA